MKWEPWIDVVDLYSVGIGTLSDVGGSIKLELVFSSCTDVEKIVISEVSDAKVEKCVCLSELLSWFEEDVEICSVVLMTEAVASGPTEEHGRVVLL